MNGRNIKLKKFGWSMPSKYITEAYEQKKKEYLQRLTTEYSDKLDNPIEKGKKGIDMILANNVYNYLIENPHLSQREVGEKFGIAQPTVFIYKNLIESYNKRIKNLPVMATG